MLVTLKIIKNRLLIGCLFISYFLAPALQGGQHVKMIRQASMLCGAVYLLNVPDHVKYGLLATRLSFDSTIKKIKEDTVLAKQIGQSLGYSSFSSYLTEVPSLRLLRKACARKLEKNNIPLNLTPTEGALLAYPKRIIAQWFNHWYFLFLGKPTAPDSLQIKCDSFIKLFKHWPRLICRLNTMLDIEKKHWHGDQRYYPMYTSMSTSNYILSYLTTLGAKLDPEKYLLLRPQIAPKIKEYLYTEFQKNPQSFQLDDKTFAIVNPPKGSHFEMFCLVKSHVMALQEIKRSFGNIDSYDQAVIRKYLLSVPKIWASAEFIWRPFCISANMSPIANLNTHGEGSLRPFLEDKGYGSSKGKPPLLYALLLSQRFSVPLLTELNKMCCNADGGVMLQILISKELLQQTSYSTGGYGTKSSEDLISAYENLANFPLRFYRKISKSGILPMVELIVTDDLLADPKGDIAPTDLKMVAHALNKNKIKSFQNAAKRMVT